MLTRPAIKRFTARLWAWIGGGGGAISLAGLGRSLWPTIWRKIQDLDTLHSLWTLVGGDVPLIISIAASPLFGLAMIVAGLLWIPAANQKIAGGKIHPLWPVAGWGVFVLCISLLLSSALFGDFAESTGVITAKRFYIEQHTDRVLSLEERNNLCERVKAEGPDTFKNLTMVADRAPEPTQYATDVFEQLKICVVKFIPR